MRQIGAKRPAKRKAAESKAGVQARWMSEAMAIIEAARAMDGIWPTHNCHWSAFTRENVNRSGILNRSEL